MSRPRAPFLASFLFSSCCLPTGYRRSKPKCRRKLALNRTFPIDSLTQTNKQTNECESSYQYSDMEQSNNRLTAIEAVVIVLV